MPNNDELKLLRRALLATVDAIERACGILPRTADLRRANRWGADEEQGAPWSEVKIKTVDGQEKK